MHKRLSEGDKHEQKEAVADFISDEYFDNWYEETLTKLQAYEDLDEIGYLRWTPVTEKAPSEFYNVPNLLLSFSDQYIVMAGRYEIDKDGEGHFYLRNEKTPCESKGLHVNAWLKMLPPYEELVSASKNFDVRR